MEDKSEVMVNGKPVHYAAKSLLPAHMQGPMQRYIEDRIEPGGFLTAVLSNDFMEAASLADETNQRYLYYIARWLYNYAPSDCYGSPEKVEAWLTGDNDLRDSLEYSARLVGLHSGE